ncbi:MAG TPA: pyridoxal-phosphate dependent enzyme [Gemmatimonadales bacterium]|jgi:threonine dehydratase
MTGGQTKRLDVRQLVLDAEERSRTYLVTTPLEYSPYLSALVDGEVWLKLDLMQRTGSFKFRGAVSKIMSLSEEQLDRGIVTASTGNYALAVAEAMRLRGRSATIYVARDIDPERLELLRARGLHVVIDGDEAGVAEKRARQAAEEEGRIYVSPYNDPLVVGGQGTCGLEIARQLPNVESVVVACGGGGLIAGSAGWLKFHSPDVEIIAVSPANSPVMYESLKAGHVVESATAPTLADTCAGNLDLDSITLALCQEYVDDFVLLTEDEIARGIRLLFEEHRLVAEGSAALGVAALCRSPERFRGKKVVLVVCGRNIGLELFRRIVA